MGNGSRLTRECHVRFRERRGAKFPGSTHPRLERFRRKVDRLTYLLLALQLALSYVRIFKANCLSEEVL